MDFANKFKRHNNVKLRRCANQVMPRVFHGARDIHGSCIMRKKFNFLLLRDRSFFMREGGLVGFGGGHWKKIGLKRGGQPKKNEGKGGGLTKNLD